VQLHGLGLFFWLQALSGWRNNMTLPLGSLVWHPNAILKDFVYETSIVEKKP